MQAGEKLALKDTTKGDVIVKLVPLIDNFEAAKNSIKVQSDAEQKIVDSYQVGVTEHDLGSMWTGACALINCKLNVLVGPLWAESAFSCSSCSWVSAECGVHHAEPGKSTATRQNGMTIASLQD